MYIKQLQQLNSNRTYIEEVERKNKIEINEVEQDYNKNKPKVIDFLFANAIEVDITVPDVVKGKFEEKFGVTQQD